MTLYCNFCLFYDTLVIIILSFQLYFPLHFPIHHGNDCNLEVYLGPIKLTFKTSGLKVKKVTCDVIRWPRLYPPSLSLCHGISNNPLLSIKLLLLGRLASHLNPSPLHGRHIGHIAAKERQTSYRSGHRHPRPKGHKQNWCYGRRNRLESNVAQKFSCKQNCTPLYPADFSFGLCILFFIVLLASILSGRWSRNECTHNHVSCLLSFFLQLVLDSLVTFSEWLLSHVTFTLTLHTVIMKQWMHLQMLTQTQYAWKPRKSSEENQHFNTPHFLLKIPSIITSIGDDVFSVTQVLYTTLDQCLGFTTTFINTPSTSLIQKMLSVSAHWFRLVSISTGGWLCQPLCTTKLLCIPTVQNPLYLH